MEPVRQDVFRQNSAVWNYCLDSDRKEMPVYGKFVMKSSPLFLNCCVVGVSVTILLSQVATAESMIRTVVGTGVPTANPISQPLKTNVGNPFGVEVGPDNSLYVTEVSNHRIWKLGADRRKLQLVAGTGAAGYRGDGGRAGLAELREPYEIRFDQAGNLFFVEMKNHVVRRIDAKTGVITTVAGCGHEGFSGDGGPATEARLSRPHSLAIDSLGNIYIADIGNHRIRKVNRESGKIHTLAGTGQKQGPKTGQLAKNHAVHGPRALFISGQTLWVALREGNSIWKLELNGHPIWQHVAGSGEKGFDNNPDLLKATFNGPKGIAVGPQGRVFVVDTENQVVRVIDTQQNKISTLAGQGPAHRGFSGDDGPSTSASLNRPHGICVDSAGRVFIGDSENHRVRMID